MAAQTFHLFRNLPRELRDLIWEFALRPKVPGVHFFKAYDPGEPDKSAIAQFTEYSLRAAPVSDYYSAEDMGLAIPRPSDAGSSPSISRTEDNRSTYMLDLALWNVCRESREAAERRFKTDWIWAHDPSEPWPEKRQLQLRPERATSGLFKSSIGNWERCIVYPRRDLFFLDPHKSVFLTGPYFAVHPAWDARHIAYEYDSRWRGPGHRPSLESGLGLILTEAMTLLSSEKNLWLVDRRIRRYAEDDSDDGDSTESDDDEDDVDVVGSDDDSGVDVTRPAAGSGTPYRHRFYGNGCVFTEVKPYDLEWEYDQASDVFTTLWKFRALQWASEEADRVAGFTDDPQCDTQWFFPRVGVLAVEFVD